MARHHSADVWALRRHARRRRQTSLSKAASFPNFPALKDFLAFWETKLEGPLVAVTVAHSKLIKPAELRAVDGVFRLH
jgi:uncharacterized protein Usg